ncbi:hypothetical protein FB45DRAFT_939969 [Roridomyces roridus]|uniref:BTB domain-containing protein n=1 Tax=Roridomyces roridus TaxID=1738132 RepID=A0AAD7FAE3_9AGAR|nr:hypothetical protein FB45DRAFT_939969 [Roridomyces roridus]
MATTTTGKEDLDEDTQALRRPDGLWFEDGNIVLQAEDTQFRVYHGLLAACSPVFQDMMALPRPPDSDSELVEGCTFVQLYDSAADTTVFLRALFYTSFFPPFPIKADFRTVLGCLRLGHKYEVDFLRRRALIHLSSACDTQLDRRDRSTKALVDPDSAHALDIVSIHWAAKASWTVTSIIIPIIQLAREVDALWLLPDAFYNLSGAFHNAFGPVAQSVAEEVFRGVDYGGRIAHLSPHDQESLLGGHAVQSKSTNDVLEFLSLPTDIPGCASSESCARERFKAIGASRARVQAFASRPLSVWGPVQWQLLKDLCPTCRSALETKHKAARQAFWDKLPEMYGLPSWDELEKMKIAAIGKDWLSQNGGS